MAAYSGIQKEETLKGLVYNDYFSAFGYEPNIDNIDFVITDKKTRNDLFSDGLGSSKHYLWAEAKKGTQDVFEMFTQLILTCRKTYQKADYLAPPWLGCFDETRIAFVSFHDLLPIFSETDFNWNTPPHNHGTADFQKAREKIKNLIGAKIVIYSFEADIREIKEFIKTHFTAGDSTSIKSPITKDNFVQIFIKWIKEVKPSINVPKDEWAEFKGKGILDCDFYRADMMSSGGNTITEKLKIILKNDNYQFQETISHRLYFSDIGFTDGGKAYSRFWNKYERPPAKIFQQFIIDRRDLLIPQNIREMKGCFFTPKIWADKSKEYLSKVFGKNWQDEYYIWDCAAGTGNLLAGLTNKYNIWASDIDQGNVETIQSLIDIDENLNLLPAHVFQFDFLNDILTVEKYEEEKEHRAEIGLLPPERKIPQELRNILDDPEKRKKLIIYINPPYAEAGNKKTIVYQGENKARVSASSVFDRFENTLGASMLELFAQFMLRVYVDISGSKLAMFSTLKHISSANFSKFRDYFKAEYKYGFICKANTFDNVKGEFPIAFLVWDLANKQKIKSVTVDILFADNEQKQAWKTGVKEFREVTKGEFSVDWLRKYFDKEGELLGYLRLHQNDIQNKNAVFITSSPSERDFVKHEAARITKKNLVQAAIYCSIRQVVEATWLNDRDQFLFPSEKWETDISFQNDCLVNVLFNNVIQSIHGTNHWIPFTEEEVNAKEKFKSNFMSSFIKGREFSGEAKAVLNSGKMLWQYYHSKIINNNTVSVNASFYDIREYFQGRNEKGTMKTKSDDEQYNTLIKELRNNLSQLAEKIKPKVYEYGFLKE